MTSGSMELAILYADACGFTAAMAASEETAIARLRKGQDHFRHSASLYGGRVIDTAGDSILMSFDSPRAAFAAARAVRDLTIEAKQTNPQDAPFDFRFGITKGKVSQFGQSIYGSCVNKAARISSLGMHRSIGVESAIWPEIRPLSQNEEVRARNVFAKPEEPVIDFFEIICGEDDSGYAVSRNAQHNAPTILILPVIGLDEQRMAQAALDDVIWNSSALFEAQGWQTVIAAPVEHATTYPGTSAEYMLAVRVAEVPGGIRLFMRIASPFIQNGSLHLSRDILNRGEQAGEILALASLASSAISHAESERVVRTRNVGAHQLVAAARMALNDFSAVQFRRAMELVGTAQRLDQDYPLLLSTLGRAHSLAWRFGWTTPGIDHQGLALEYAKRAIGQPQPDSRCEADLGFVTFWNKETSEALWHYDRSLDALPFHPELAADAGMVYSYANFNDKATSVLEHSIANLPHNPDYRLWSLGDVYYAKRDYRNSLKWVSRMNDQSQAQRLLAANKARLGLDASAHVAKVLEQQPDFSVKRWVSIQPFTDENDRMDFEEALLLAGLPP